MGLLSGGLFCWPAERHQAGLCVIADVVPNSDRELVQALLGLGQEHQVCDCIDRARLVDLPLERIGAPLCTLCLALPSLGLGCWFNSLRLLLLALWGSLRRR